MPTSAYSIVEFCRAHGVSRAFVYALLKRGEGPAIMKAGRRTLVSVEAAAEWRRRMEALATTKPLQGGEAVMSGLFPMPGVEHRLLYVELADHDDPWFVIPIARAVDQGFPVARIKPGADFERPTLPIAWIVIIDDRASGASGPSSFDAGTLRWLFADAYRIAVDAAESQIALYEHFVEEGIKGMRILVIRTVESRVGVWREFSRENCGLSEILELGRR